MLRISGNEDWYDMLFSEYNHILLIIIMISVLHVKYSVCHYFSFILPMKITCVLVRAVLYCLLKMHYLSCCFYINLCLLK